ncbi:bifunctional DNA primase/polymerase [Methanocalculus sp. MC3]
MTTDPDQLRIFLNRADEVGASYRFLPLDMSGRKSKPPSWKAKDGGILESAVSNRDEAIAHIEGGLNLAVLCMDEGPDSLIIIDPDIANIPETQREGYITRIEAVIDECDCFTVRTPSGGWHIYCVNDSRAYNGGFVHPDYGDITVIDVQSDRVYAVSPGSWLRRTEIKDGAIKGMPPVYHVVRDAPIRSGSLVFTSLENHGFKFVESAKKDKNTELRKMIIS